MIALYVYLTAAIYIFLVGPTVLPQNSALVHLFWALLYPVLVPTALIYALYIKITQ